MGLAGAVVSGLALSRLSHKRALVEQFADGLPSRVGGLVLVSGVSASVPGYPLHFLLAAGLTGLVIIAALFRTSTSDTQAAKS